MTVPSVSVRGSFAAYGADWIMGPHDHDAYEISVVLQGSGAFISGGIRYPLEAGHVVLVPGAVSHDYHGKTPIRFGVLEACGMPESVSQLMGMLTPEGKPRVLTLSPLALTQYEDLYKQALRMISRPLQEEVRCLVAWAELLLLFLLQHQSSQGLSLSIASSADYVRANVGRELPIAMLARECGLSESAFRAQFKAAYGSSPKRYQQQCRIEEAKWQLRATAKSVQQIGESVGFASIHSFSAWFQKMEGASPSDWRRSQQGLGGSAHRENASAERIIF